VFSYTLPQNVHIAVAARHQVPSGRTYPGFFAPVADTVRDVDRCFGEFVEYLRQTGRYDDSIVILTADHGDSLGEEGRWGHGYFMVPEVVRVPLLIHLPPSLRTRVATDLSRVAFTTDLAPTLYALTGNEAADLGPLFGSPLFVEPGTDLSARRRQSFVLASSYGAVYGMLRHNGRKLYAADAVDGRDDAYDMSDDRMDRRVAITQAMRSLNRRLITEQLDTLAALNHYDVQP
jgi:arylsulfatase A-like enzyme